MPISVMAPHGVLTASGEREIVPKLSAALLEASGLAGNSFFTPIVGGHLSVLPPEHVFAGGVNRPLVVVELTAPNIALSTTDVRAQWIKLVTDIVDECTVPWHDRTNTWVNMVNAPDGGWGIGGRAWTGDDLVEAVTRAAQLDA